MINFYKKGFTAIEMLFVVAIVLFLIGIALPSFYKIRENQVLKDTTSDVISSLDKARSQTLSSLNSSEYGVRFESNRVIIFTGTAYVSNAASNETISIVSGASITNATLGGVSGTSGEMYFNRLSGSPSKTGTVTVTTTNFTKTITIGATGFGSVN